MQLRNVLRCAPVVMVALVGLVATNARAEVLGVQGTAFALTAKADRITTPDGNSILIWGYSVTGRAQYPGPTLIVNQGSPISISVTNALPAGAGQRVSLTFPGQEGVTAVCSAQPCVQGPLALEAGLGGMVTYTFTASRAGTFQYTSGSQPELQIEMGLFGALIVRPATPNQAYEAPESAYDREFLFLLSDMDSRIHDMVESEGVQAVYESGLLNNFFANYWFINGRNAPDTMAADGGSHLPTQPYGALVRVHTGDRVLMRVIGAGHDLHPFHHHGNHARIIAVDGHLLQSTPGGPVDLSHEVFTIQSVPGQTVDAIFSWTGKDLGWDAFGTGPEFAHLCNGLTVASAGFDPTTNEYCPDHGKPIPVVLPEQLSTVFGGFWSGSPYLGVLGLLPPGEGGNNPDAGYTFMWHSHTEKEIINFDVFPGGMMTMLIVLPKSVSLP